jgi:glycosyltransferase involved in cell wall biosynthesis
MSKNYPKKICFLHYGIGWRDGINTVIETLAKEIQRKNPYLKLYFIGGEVKKQFLKKASYQIIPELLPKRTRLLKRQIQKESEIIAQKLAKLTKGIEVVVIENPFMGSYHLPAMLGFSLYTKKQKPKGTKLFFRIHDFYKDSPIYFKEVQKIFSPSEIREILSGEGVDGFLVVNRALKEKLVKEGISKHKIFYLPNGIDGKLFNQPLKREEKNLIYQNLKIPETAKVLLYPVRIVPRKNITEAIFLTKFLRKITKENYILVVSGKIDENDPQSRAYYEKLKELKKSVNFPVIFTKKSFPLERKYSREGKLKKFSIGDLYQISQAIVMTSLREGFGYPFLECWFSRKIIIGRRIDEVINDFEKSGLKFWWLYRKFSLSGVEKQAEILQNKEKQRKIIKANLKAAKKVYEISKVTDRFLELVNLK